VVEHALVLCDDLPLLRDHLPDRLGAARAGTSPARPEAAAAPQSATHPASAAREAVQQAARDVATCSRPLSLRELEMEAIQRGLERNQGNKARTAEELGISLKTLYNKLHQLQESLHESLQEAASRGVA
jgi:DNA-binding NtrC family response regulator